MNKKALEVNALWFPQVQKNYGGCAA